MQLMKCQYRKDLSTEQVVHVCNTSAIATAINSTGWSAKTRESMSVLVNQTCPPRVCYTSATVTAIINNFCWMEYKDKESLPL